MICTVILKLLLPNTLIYLTSRNFTIVLDEATQLRDEPILNSHRLGYPPSTNIESISYCLNQDQQEGIKTISILFVSTHINVQIKIWTYPMISPSILAGISLWWTRNPIVPTAQVFGKRPRGIQRGQLPCKAVTLPESIMEIGCIMTKNRI